MLAGFAADPRIARVLVEVVRNFVGEDSYDVHRAVANVVERMPSARLLPALDAVEVVHGAMIYADARHAIAQRTTEVAEPSLLERARDELGTDDDLDALFAQLEAAPGDLALRGVIADRLQAAGDPRGDFIALQLDGSPAALRKADELLAIHAESWTGPLPGIDPVHRRFARGFLVAAFVELQPPARSRPLERSLGRPEWATIEELGVGGFAADVASLVARMPLLRRFAGPRWAVEQIAAAGGGKSIRTVVVTDNYLPADPTMFPALEVLLWTETWSPLAKRLRRAKELGLRIVGQVGVSPEDLVRAVKAGRGLDLELRFSWGGPDRGLWIPGWQMRIAADRSIADFQYGGGRHALQDAGRCLQALVDAGIPRIVIHRPAPATRAAANAITGAKIEIRDERFDLLG